jgi:RNA polymerase sigma factor (sigma-70 family)
VSISHLNDGFGDTLSAAEAAQAADCTEMLLTKERLLQIMVAERRVPPNDYEDALQEARITLWRVMSAKPDVAAAYLHRAAAYRITECRDRQTWTGHTRHHGQPTDPLRRVDRDSLDDPDSSFEAAAPEVFDSVLIAYHEGEIVRALNLLPARDREYVVLRFWGGLTHAEIAARQNLSKQHMQRIWLKSTKPRLAQALAHLASAF